jgi:hypothetical protein
MSHKRLVDRIETIIKQEDVPTSQRLQAIALEIAQVKAIESQRAFTNAQADIDKVVQRAELGHKLQSIVGTMLLLQEYNQDSNVLTAVKPDGTAVLFVGGDEYATWKLV